LTPKSQVFLLIFTAASKKICVFHQIIAQFGIDCAIIAAETGIKEALLENRGE